MKPNLFQQKKIEKKKFTWKFRFPTLSAMRSSIVSLRRVRVRPSDGVIIKQNIVANDSPINVTLWKP